MCQSNQRKNFVLFILVSLFLSLRDYAGNARNAGMLLRLSSPSNKRIPNTLFSSSSVTVDSIIAKEKLILETAGNVSP
jgi:hypothetical protein